VKPTAHVADTLDAATELVADKLDELKPALR
jgi:hypothetical protein